MKAGLTFGPAQATNERGIASGLDIVFRAGRKGGGYWGVAERFRSVSAESGLKVKSYQDLQHPAGHRIAIPGEESGVAVTFDYMKKLVPGLENTEPVYTTDTVKAMKKIRAGDRDAVDAVMLVQRPLLRKPEIHFAASKPSVFHMISAVFKRGIRMVPNNFETYFLFDGADQRFNDELPLFYPDISMEIDLFSLLNENPLLLIFTVISFRYLVG